MLVLAALAGCSMLASKEVAVGCQVADIATTARALHLSATAYETNALPIPLLFAFKIALAVYIWKSDWDKAPEEPRIIVNALACAPIPGNLKVAKGG